MGGIMKPQKTTSGWAIFMALVVFIFIWKLDVILQSLTTLVDCHG